MWHALRLPGQWVLPPRRAARGASGSASEVPHDLARFAENMRARGIEVRLPNAAGSYEMPQPIEVAGEPLSATLLRLRGDP